MQPYHFDDSITRVIPRNTSSGIVLNSHFSKFEDHINTFLKER